MLIMGVLANKFANNGQTAQPIWPLLGNKWVNQVEKEKKPSILKAICLTSTEEN